MLTCDELYMNLANVIVLMLKVNSIFHILSYHSYFVIIILRS